MTSPIRPLILLTCCLATQGLSVNADATALPEASKVSHFAERGDIRHLPGPLKKRLIRLAERPHSYPPLTVFAEAPKPSRLFGYYLLDTHGFEPNVFTTAIAGINDGTAPTATGANHDDPPSPPSAWRWNPSPVCRRIRTMRAPSSTSSRTSPAYS